MMEIYNCELWEKAKVLAQDRGFKMSDNCPMTKNCPETRCVFIKPDQTEEQKLQELRDELNEIKNASYEGVKVVEIGV